MLIFFTEYTWHIPFIKPKKASACVEDDLATVGVNEEEAVNWKMQMVIRHLTRERVSENKSEQVWWL